MLFRDRLAEIKRLIRSRAFWDGFFMGLSGPAMLFIRRRR